MTTPGELYTKANVALEEKQRELDIARLDLAAGINNIRNSCWHIFEICFGDSSESSCWSVHKPYDGAVEHSRCVWCGIEGEGNESPAGIRAQAHEDTERMKGMTDAELYGVSEDDLPFAPGRQFE